MDWSTIYQSRVTTAEEAVKAIKSGNRIFMTGNVSVPQKTLAALVEYVPRLKNVELCQALSVGPADYVNPDLEGHLRVNSMFISANIRKAVQSGVADFTPVLLSEFLLEFFAYNLRNEFRNVAVELGKIADDCRVEINVSGMRHQENSRDFPG